MKLAVVIFLLIPGLAFCEQGQSASKPSQVVPPVPTAGANDTFSIEYKDADNRKAISGVAKLFGIKVVMPKDFPAGSASIRLRDVTWRQFFQVVLAPVGYSFIERDDEVDVMTVEQIKNLPPERRPVKLDFQRPADLAIYLKRIFKSRITVEKTADGVIFSTNPSHTHMILQEIARVDRPEVSLERFIHPRKLYFPDSIPRDLPPPALSPGESGQEPELVTTEVIMLNWVDGEPVKEIIEREYPAQAEVMADERGLVITCTHAQLRKVKALVAYLDDKKWYEPLEKRSKTTEPPAITPPAAQEPRQPHALLSE